MARLSRPPPPSRARRTIFSSSSESESESEHGSSNSNSDSDFPDIAKKHDTVQPTRRKRPSPPTDTTSTSSNRRTVVESATSPNAASSTVTGGGVKRRKLLLGAVSDNVLFRKWTPAHGEEDEAPVRKKRRNLTASNNNPFGSRLPLGMGDEGDGEDSEAENPVVQRRKMKEVKSVGGSTVTGKKVVKTTTKSLVSEQILQEKPRKGLEDTMAAKKEKTPLASLVHSTKQVVSRSKNMMQIDKEEEMDIFEDLEDFAEESFHTACSRESSGSDEEESKTKVTKASKTDTASNPKDDDDDSDEDLDAFFSKLNSKPKTPMVRESHLSPTKPRSTKNSRSRQMDTTWESQNRTLFDDSESDERQSRTASSNKDTCGEEDVTQDFSCLQLESSSSSSSESSETETERSRPKKQRSRTPSPPPKIPKLKPTTNAAPNLPPSPKKLPRIPSTPHRPSSDLFWSREFVDDWNDEHSPVKKELFPSNKPAPDDSPNKKKKKEKGQPRPPSPSKLAALQARESRLLRQAFNTHKHSLATTFLSLLDTRLTSGRLSSLTANTGGIKIVWSKTLNTTAGRANWKKESITSRPCRQQQEEKKEVKHHASIELATKVLSTPERLFNTLAHEFCHLAVFMIDGVTTRPHGAEFKAWARRANEEFGLTRGEQPLGKLNPENGKWEGGYSVEVTTRHGYEIEFRYVWVCDGPASGPDEKGCGTEYKRHSKSVDPARHRCGVCKGVLRQVKPAPRGQQASSQGGGGEREGSQQEGTGGMGTTKIMEKAKTSEYQAFVKEQMKVVKAQKPGLAFGEVMKEVAERWKVEKVRREKEKGPKKEALSADKKVGTKLSTLLEDVVADEDDSPGMLEDEEMMDVVDLTADD
ncbi:SprT-like family-domain-containing protein [Sordaria brevicollis]|uniref:SprT-like family-domain-containing protein n=1 Tax=Sordaria brevicollis TaxID=83679 RepID=A0AAE0U2L9_SORBR|nr:SprT-like family-domain-containing protein [Sordaria brevicollis]